MRKRWIIGGIVLLVLVGAYTGYWFWLAQSFERNLAAWIEQQRAMGYRVEYSAGKPAGYPLWIEIQLSDVTATPNFADPSWRLDAAMMRLSLAPWRPLVLRVGERAFPSRYRLRWMAADRAYEATVKGLGLAIGLSAGNLPPTIDISSHWFMDLKQDSRDIVSFGGLSGRVELANAATHADTSIRFDLSSCCVNFRAPDLSQETIETYDWHITGRIMGRIPQQPLPEALAAWSKEGGLLELTQLKADWEAVTRISIEGSGALDPQLQPVASLTAHLHNYPDLIDWLVTIRALTSSQATATRLALAAMSRRDAAGEMEARVPLTIQNGYLSVGAIKIAQMPRIAWQ